MGTAEPFGLGDNPPADEGKDRYGTKDDRGLQNNRLASCTTPTTKQLTKLKDWGVTGKKNGEISTCIPSCKPSVGVKRVE
jgi:hypothetical protein